jgi:hypothetical protein
VPLPVHARSTVHLKLGNLTKGAVVRHQHRTGSQGVRGEEHFEPSELLSSCTCACCESLAPSGKGIPIVDCLRVHCVRDRFGWTIDASKCGEEAVPLRWSSRENHVTRHWIPSDEDFFGIEPECGRQMHGLTVPVHEELGCLNRVAPPDDGFQSSVFQI